MDIKRRLQIPADPTPPKAPPPSLGALKAKVLEASEPEPESIDPKRQREYSFTIDLKLGGRRYTGTFKNRILNVMERMQAGSLASDLVQGRDFRVLPDSVRQLAVAMSWMAFSLDEKTRPSWAKDLGAIDDEQLINALFEEVWAHQTTFLGRNDGQGNAAEKTGGADRGTGEEDMAEQEGA